MELGGKDEGETQELRIVSLGNVYDWTIRRARFNLSTRGEKTRRRVVLTSVEEIAGIRAVEDWVSVQDSLIPETPPRSGKQVFWRLVIDSTAIALGTRSFSSVNETLAHARAIAVTTADLTVGLAYFAMNPTPNWVVLDNGRPVLVGVPGSRVVLTSQPDSSLGNAISLAMPEPYVHEAEARMADS